MKDLDRAEAQLLRVLNFFPRVESRLSGLFATNTVLLTVAALNVEASDLQIWYVALSAFLMLLALLGSYFFLYRANFPDVRGGQGSLIYFVEIQKRTESKFIAEFEACDEDHYRADILGQTWRNSQILCEKYTGVRYAIVCTTASLLPFAVFLISTALLHSRVPLVNG